MSADETGAGAAKHRVLLTGATGFVGFRMARRLLSLGHEVVAIVRRGGEAGGLESAGDAGGGRYREIVGDFVDPATSRTAAEGCDVVFHGAATSGPDWDSVRRVNTEGTRAMLDAAIRAVARRFVQISTVSVYDFAALDDSDLDEESPLCTDGEPYGVTKAEGDRLVIQAASRGLAATILRPGAILGLHPTSTWAVKVPRRIREGAALPPRNPASTHPFVHVEDLVDAALLAIAANPTPGSARVYNAVSHNGTWGAYVAEVHSWFGLGPPPAPEGGARASSRSWTGRVLSERIRCDVGWGPTRTYAEGMREAEAHWISEAGAHKGNA